MIFVGRQNLMKKISRKHFEIALCRTSMKIFFAAIYTSWKGTIFPFLISYTSFHVTHPFILCPSKEAASILMLASTGTLFCRIGILWTQTISIIMQIVLYAFWIWNFYKEYFSQLNINRVPKQAGVELGKAQIKHGFGFTSVYLYKIDELQISLARLTLTTICHLAQVEQSKSNFKWLRFA